MPRSADGAREARRGGRQPISGGGGSVDDDVIARRPMRTRRGGALSPRLASAHIACLLVVAMSIVAPTAAFPDAGVFTLAFNASVGLRGITKNMYNGTTVLVRIDCASDNPDATIKVGWVLRETRCWNEYTFLADRLKMYYNEPNSYLHLPAKNYTANWARAEPKSYPCKGSIDLETAEIQDYKSDTGRTSAAAPEVYSRQSLHPSGGVKTDEPVYSLDHDGDYLLLLSVEGDVGGGIGTATDVGDDGAAIGTAIDVGDDGAAAIGTSPEFSATATVKLKGPRGYLSIVDWPLLPFYGIMCAFYVLLGLAWLVVCARFYKDLLRIQFWIGGVVFLGMLEKAMFVAEYSNINGTGQSTKGLIAAAELTSCTKRSLARMLVIIVSLGFGIVKPRLGPTLHRVIAIGSLYGLLASGEALLRVYKPKNDVSAPTLLAGIPLAVIDSTICWWVFSALVQTTRTLRLRRNFVKLSIYRHFTNTLAFAVLASIVFMLWSIKYHRLEECLQDWRDLWMDEAFWHLLFSVILMVIMVLWTPSKNNQRYAFTPLLDNEEDELLEDEGIYNDAFTEGMKMRKGDSASSSRDDPKDEELDPLKWIEENIPESGENPLPVLDSDEEIETTKFEISKML